MRDNYFQIVDNLIPDVKNYLKDKKGSIVIDLVGSASAKGTPEGNKTLSEQRTTTINDYFKKSGIRW